ncbi:D-alanine--D-alanine ligase B [Roseovarius albus]|uniref:D-alanine--D-alanine ligase n=1 Tax=Roseovarius albus TaxID=1247867 RepID=A0A1X6YRI0_9RHOB|nr:D-alanine--D-alanine ligase [Roseovarius albus]SLN29140.1 D-alanine--D-alanine ligase B [Roseovarius albus]
MRIAIMTGGHSLERELSFRSGTEAEWAIKELGHDCKTFDVGSAFVHDLTAYAPDVAFCALLGAPGENGELQGLLELLEIPYTHSGTLATALTMDKTKSKAVLSESNLPVPKGKLVHRQDIEAEHQMDAPYVIKPNDNGSSLGGLYLVENLDNPPPKIKENGRDIFMIEEYVPGRELTVSVLGDRPLAASQFEFEGVNDYVTKYHHASENHTVPAQLPCDVETRLMDLALATHRALGCRGLTRTDFRWDEARGPDGLYILELNSQPGFRRNSYSGLHAKHCGIDFPQLCDWLIQDASLMR